LFRFLSSVILFHISALLFAQQDSIRSVVAGEVKIRKIRPLPVAEWLSDENNFTLVSGRKSSVIRLDHRFTDLTSAQSRQLFAKVAGITVWENDGSGIQTSVASRGLSPNRSWEFNVRQDGADISSDPFGYPEAYFTPPSEALDRIEIVRGAASLSYGPQFGGVINYCIKKARLGSPLKFSSTQTLASFGTFNSFQSFSGSAGRWFWTAWLHHRNAEGWRKNSRYFTRSGYFSLAYAFHPDLTLELNTTLFNMLSQQPGGLSDADFNVRPAESGRNRNWLSTPWNMASLTLQHQVNDSWKYEIKLFGNLSERNSVGFVRSIIIPDTINLVSGNFNPRQVDQDEYKNIGLEIRNMNSWKMAGNIQVLTTGLRVFSGHTLRKQMGTGSISSDFDLGLLSGPAKHLQYQTRNLAFFAEQLLRFGGGFTLTPGARLEWIDNRSSGQFGPKAEEQLPDQSKIRMLLLPGITASWKLAPALELYANYSKAFRPVTFAELTPSASTETVDPELTDSRGYNAESGLRGQISAFRYDVNLFLLSYKNRIGLMNNVRTNIGNSLSRGLEGLLEFEPLRLISKGETKPPSVSVFVSGAIMRAEYSAWKDKSPGKDFSGKKVEYAPDLTLRSGLQFLYRAFSFSAIWSHQSSVYSDALNTEMPSANAQLGRIPAWSVIDLSTTFAFWSGCQLKIGVNNLLDTRYATRRAGGYPGPGLLPGLARNFYGSFSVNF